VRINVAVPESNVSPPVLDAALEAVTRLNESLIQEGAPTFREALDTHGIQWKPEPPGAEHFDHAQTVLGRGWGDCDDLAPFHAASLRVTGEDPEARAIVERGDGPLDDPSKEAGMGRPRPTRGATLPMISTRGESSVVGAYRIRPQIALRPAYGIWQARADLPWHWKEEQDRATPTQGDFSMAALHAAPVASTALTGCIDGLIDLADCSGFGDPEHLDHLLAIADTVEGYSYDEIADKYGPDAAKAAHHLVGSFWGSIARAVKKVAPVVSKAVSFIPGVGPIASTALDLGTKLIPSGGGKRPAPPPAQPIAPGLAALQSGASPRGRQGQLCIPATFG